MIVEGILLLLIGTILLVHIRPPASARLAWIASFNSIELFDLLRDKTNDRIASIFKEQGNSGQTFLALTEEDVSNLLPTVEDQVKVRELRRKYGAPIGWVRSRNV